MASQVVLLKTAAEEASILCKELSKSQESQATLNSENGRLAGDLSSAKEELEVARKELAESQKEAQKLCSWVIES